tara:strand:- start:679 stop:1050 length:372 start_codon:yes stop_codon:yes gene_type:complete
MAKKRLKQLIEEYQITEKKAMDIVENVLDDDMITGRGKNLWINEWGQSLFEDNVSVPIIRRGRSVRKCPNPRFIFVRCEELIGIVPASIKYGTQDSYENKIVYIEEDNNFSPPRYKVIKTPRN